MYLPRQFDQPAQAAAVMREHPLGSLVTTDDEGFPYVTHLPLRLETLAGGEQRLLGHCARANPQWKHLLQRPMALVSFMGPHAYMSPKVYADLQRVPTWSYVAVQARVRARVIEGEAAKDALLKQLIADHEPTYADQWRALPEDYTEKMLKAIVAFELDIVDLQCAVKLNQHRPESHAAMYQAYRAGGANEQALADWMQRMGLV
ncbi:MAG: Protease synthase and sporulation protein 2 [Pseudomonadota bacterium]|jgi:transcriptional regulator